MLVDPGHTALEDREHALDGVGVHIAACVFLAAMVRVLLTDLAELLMFIGHEVRAGIEVIFERFLDVGKNSCR